jgi:hypothetical protein
MTPREKAERAQQLLTDGLFKGVLSDIRNGLVERLETVGMDDLDTQHEVAISLQLLKRIPLQLQKYIADHQMSEHMEKQRSFMDRIREKFTP